MHALAWAIGPLTFGEPVLLWGAAGAAAPIIIHLMLRPRPRRQPFPAIRFILQSRDAAERTNRLKRLLLLLMRMAAIGCIAALLAQPHVRAARWVPVGSGPISAAFCIDDSASMAYRFEGKTRVDVAKDMAQSLVNDRGRFGEESEFVVLTSGFDAPGAKPLDATLDSSRAAVVRRIDAVVPASHDYPVGRMIRRADELLAKAKHPRREIYVFTDSTTRGWRDLSGSPLAMASAATVFCVDVGVNEDANTSLALASAPQHSIPTNAPIHIDLAVRAGVSCPQLVKPSLEVRVDDQPRLRCSVPPSDGSETAGGVKAGQTVGVPITLPGLSEGLHRIAIELTPPDPLPCDNVRYACVQVGELPQVAVIGGDDSPDSAVTLVSAMLAPPTLPDDRQRLRLTRLAPADAATAKLGPFRCVFLVDVPALDEQAWRNLTDYARKGGVVVTILGGSVAADRYGQGADLLPALPGEIVQFETPSHLAPTDLTNPLLAPFTSPGVDSLSDRAVFRTWTIRKMGSGATVVCPLSAGQPGLIEGTVGVGRSILLTFSPQREWSEFAAQAAPMILLLHTIVVTGSPATDRMAYATSGLTKAVTLPPQTEPNVELHIWSGKEDAPTRRVNLATAGGHIAIPTAQVGHVVITPAEHSREPIFLCAVNAGDEESDLRRLPPDQIAKRFAPGVATTAENAAELRQVQRRQRVGLDATIPAGVALLILLLAESAFANRFYKRISPKSTHERPPVIA